MKKNLFKISLLFLSICVCASCEKDDATTNDQGSAADSSSPYKYIYVLNEGNWGNNDASLDRISTATGNIEKDIFASQNSRNIGDIANDMIIYGSKVYIVVNQSNTIEVVNPSNAKSVKTISLTDKSPRKITASGGFVYVSCYSDEIVKIDTATLSVSATCNVGRDPESLCIVGNKLYVANSGGLDYPNYDTTISIVNLNTFQEEKRITIGSNPSLVASVGNNRIIVLCNGNYSDINSSLSVLNIETESVEKHDYPCTKFFVSGNTAYCYNFDWAINQAVFFKVDLETYSKTTFVLNESSSIVCPYDICVNPYNKDIYVTDSQNSTSNGDVYCFSSTGVFKWKKECGANPSKIIFY